MTDLTDDQVRALLDEATPGSWRADGEPWNRTVWRSSENRVCFMAHSNGLDDDRDIATSELVAAAPDLARALLQARADAAAAQAAMIERAAEQADPWDGPVTKNKIVDAQAIAAQQIKARIRALAPDAGTAELAKLRERAEKAEAQFDRLDAAWASRVAVLQADGDAARKAAADSYASLAQANLRARNAYMRGLLDSAQHLRSTIPDNPDTWEQIESMARMMDTMATLEAARHIAEGQTK